MKFSSVIENKLKFLKLSINGKIRFTPFADKVLYHAYNKMLRTYDEIPEYPYNTFYAFCLLEAKRINLEPNWNMIANFPNFNESDAATTEGEKFDMKKCHHRMDNLNNYKKNPNKYKKVYHRTNHGPTFNEGVEYWKHGKLYKYPDQALDEDSNPAQPQESYVPPKPKDDPIRMQSNPYDELKKAIRSGNINKDGLALLRGSFVDKPELLSIIDAYLESPTELKNPEKVENVACDDIDAMISDEKWNKSEHSGIIKFMETKRRELDDS